MMLKDVSSTNWHRVDFRVEDHNGVSDYDQSEMLYTYYPIYHYIVDQTYQGFKIYQYNSSGQTISII